MAFGGSTVVSTIYLRAVNQFSAEFRTLQKDFNDTSNMMASRAAGMSAALGGLAAFMTRVGLVPALVGAFSASVATHFDAASAQISTFTNVSGAQLQKLSAHFLDLSRQTGVSATEIMKASYPLLSMGMSAQQASIVMDQSAKVAAASQSDLKDVVEAVTAVLREYHVSTQDTAHYIDMMDKSVVLGTKSWEEFARGIATAIPVAAAMHVPFAQVASLLDTLIQRGISFRQAAQDVNATLRGLEVPGRMQIVTAKMLGLSWQQLYGSGKDVIQTILNLSLAQRQHVISSLEAAQATGYHAQRLGILAEQLQNPNERMKMLVGSSVALNTVLRALGDQGGRTIIERSMQIAGATNQVNTAFDHAKDHAYIAFGQMRESLRVVAVEIGSALLPALASIARALVPIMTAMASFAAQHHTLVAVLILSGAAMLAFGGAIKVAEVAIRLYSQAIASLRIMMAALQAPSLLFTRMLNDQGAAAEMLAGKIDLARMSRVRAAVAEAQAAAAARGDLATYNRLGTAMAQVEGEWTKSTDASIGLEAAERKLAATRQGLIAGTNRLPELENDLIVARKALTDSAVAGIVAERKLADAKLIAGAATKYLSGLQSDQKLIQSALSKELAIYGGDLAKARAASATFTAQEKLLLDTEKAIAAQEVILSARTKDVAVAQDLATLSAKNTGKAQNESLGIMGAVAAMKSKLAGGSKAMAAAEGEQAIKAGESTAANEGLLSSITRLIPAGGGLASTFGMAGASLGEVAVVIAIVVAILAVITGAFVWLYQNVRFVHDALTGLHDGITALGNELSTDFRGALYMTIAGFEAISQRVSNFINLTVDRLGGAIHNFLSLFGIMQDGEKKTSALAGAVGGLADKFHGLANAVSMAVTPLTMFFGLAQDVTGWVGHESEVLHKAAAAHDAHAQSTEKDATIWHAYIMGYNAVSKAVAASVASMAQSHRLWVGAIQHTNAEIAKMRADATKEFLDMKRSTTVAFTAQTQQAIQATTVMRVGVIAEVKAMVAEYERFVAGMKAPALTMPASTFRPPSGASIAAEGVGQTESGAASLAASMAKPVAELSSAMAKLPPAFKKAGDDVVAGFQKQAQAVFADYSTKIAAENARYAGVVKQINADHEQKLRDLFSSATTQRQSEDQRHETRINAINQANEQRISSAMMRFQQAVSTAGSNFNASLQTIHAQLDLALQNHIQRQRDIWNNYLQMLRQHNGEFEKGQRDRLHQEYENEKNLENQRFNGDKANADRHVIEMSQALQRFNERQQQTMQNWLVQNDATFRRQIAAEDGIYKNHTTRIQSTLDANVVKWDRLATAQLNKQRAIHEAHITGIRAAFDTSIGKIQKAMSAAASGAGIWDKVKQESDDLAQNSLKRLALAILEGSKNIGQLAAAARLEEAGTKKMNAAMTQAEKMLGLVKDKAKQVADMFDQLAKSAQDRVKKAMDQLAYDIAVGNHDAIAADTAALKEAAIGQRNLTLAMAQAQGIVDKINATQTKHKAVVDQVVAAYDKMKTKIDGAVTHAFDQLMLDLEKGKSIGKDMAAYEAALKRQTKLADDESRIKDRLDREQLARQTGLSMSTIRLAQAFDKASQTTQTKLTMATNAAAEEFMRTGRVSQATWQQLDKLTAESQKFEKALAQIADRQARAALARETGLSQSTIRLSQAFDKAKQAADDRLSTSLKAAALQFARTGTISASTVAQLQRLQAQSKAFDDALAKVTLQAQALDMTLKGIKERLDKGVADAMEAYTHALYDETVGIHHSASELAQLRQAALNATLASNQLSAAEQKAKASIDAEVAARNHDINGAMSEAKARYDAALSALEFAKATGASAAEILKLTKDAQDAGVQFERLNQIVTQTEKDITDFVDTTLGIAQDQTDQGLTPYQEAELGVQDQRLQMQQQKTAFEEQMQQARFDAKQQQQATQDNTKATQDNTKATQDQTAALQSQVAAQQALIELLQRQLYEGAVGQGIQRVTVTGRNYISYLNGWAGQSYANGGRRS